jgi:hypothetical protein
MRRSLVAALCVALTLPQPALAYLKFGTRVGGRQVTVKWAQAPVRYFVNAASTVPGVTVDDFQSAVARAFAQWQAVPTSSITYQFAGLTAAQPGDDDGISTLGFRSRPDLDRVLASTSFTVDASTGALVESDIFFNSTFAWSVASGGDAGRQDLESIALHEIGHLHGLGHSMIGETELVGGGRRVLGAEAIMFPIAFSAGTVNRTLRDDDIAGISDIYGDSTFRGSTGSITGRVTKNGTGVLGAHIVAFNPASGKLVGGFTLSDDGTFTIAGLEPGPQVVRVEPLDDGDISSFLDPALNIDVNFKVVFYNKLVVVPRGGTAPSIEVKVVAK